MATQKTTWHQSLKCPGCSTINPRNHKFCISCGESLAVTCRYCGTETKVDRDPPRYCPNCCGDLRSTHGLSYEQRQRQKLLPLLLEKKGAEQREAEEYLVLVKQKMLVASIKVGVLWLAALLGVWWLCSVVPRMSFLTVLLLLALMLWLGRRMIPAVVHAALTRSWGWGCVLGNGYRDIAEINASIASIALEARKLEREQEELAKLEALS